MSNPPHGTRARYLVAGGKCRCEACTKANNEYMREYRLLSGRTKVSFGPRNGGAPHGTRTKYTHGCRCEDCTVANRNYQREYMRLRRSWISMTDPFMKELGMP